MALDKSDVIGSILSAKLDMLNLHQYFGVSLLGLISFRILWGFVGTYYFDSHVFLSQYLIFIHILCCVIHLLKMRIIIFNHIVEIEKI